ncbi:MAG: TetR/AcrR family transcriptional regulator [Prolixibacteraceae bacterium]|jgi:AcrR family transcriptional regulator|nr:TetR/AcrR family transcriptional regulator [Prolixibacteraceae bacterium]MBT6007308.1 TetR/AcrR family transcriptional regulator [Prolixibacteraceae bacterium]MBT6762986.1 TetR/AcrR family transcriptional regulator [Prolixibacteraceae bacterium]MBT6997489.1 TetR/AcrR family transcriptional regulator [Prolixibacteraceae bacterium]MBT7396173.1 TetR/AcrR family transcriptional regulator [Prolixibacteraceae bacterium]
MNNISSSKRNDILKTAHDLFWKHGIKRVSIEEICKDAGVSKMTFYKFFPNKIELVKTILDNLIEESITKLNQILASKIPFSEKLKQLFLMKIEGMDNFSMEFMNDIYTNPETGLKEYMEEKQMNSMGIIIDFYKDSQKKGFIRKEVKIDFILAYSAQIFKLMEDKNLIAQYNQPQDFVLESMNLLFYGIVTGNE